MRFGVFNQGENEPIQEYEGDYSKMKNPPYVEIFEFGSHDDAAKPVAHIHLGPGQGIDVMDCLGHGRKTACRRLGGAHRNIEIDRGSLVIRLVDTRDGLGIQWPFLDVIYHADDLDGLVQGDYADYSLPYRILFREHLSRHGPIDDGYSGPGGIIRLSEISTLKEPRPQSF
jgi:hypothetical protein